MRTGVAEQPNDQAKVQRKLFRLAFIGFRFIARPDRKGGDRLCFSYFHDHRVAPDEF